MRRYDVFSPEGVIRYYGFDRDFKSEHVLALIQVEDTMEMFALDNADQDTINQLSKYLTELHGDTWKMIGTYKEQGFLGFTLDLWRVSKGNRFLQGRGPRVLR